jgi:diacylglycerol kinase (ATP)
MPAVWFLHNSRAGRAAFARAVDQAAEAVARRGVLVEVVRHAEIAALQAAARQAVAAGAEAVLAAGGDGTLGALAGELAHTPVAFGVLPAGTANVWARAAGAPRVTLLAPRALERAALQALAALPRLADLGRCNGLWFISWAGLGLDAYVVKHYERARERAARQAGGYWYNLLLTFSAARGWRAADMRLEAAGPNGAQQVEGRFLMATVCNIGLHGGGLMAFSRDWRLDDGLMDLWAFRGQGYADGLAHAARVFAGAHHRHPAVVRLTGSRFDLYTPTPQAAHVDGEPGTSQRHLSVEVVPRCLRLLAPVASASNFNHSPT